MEQIALLKPSQIVIKSPPKTKSAYKLWSDSIDKLLQKKSVPQYAENFKKQNLTFQLSKATKKKIAESLNSLEALSKPRTITTYSGKAIYNFRIGFYTLTLPYKQRHSDTEIKEKCLNQLFTELREKHGLKNYLWKAELQRNKNIHFHIFSDTYIDYHLLKRLWNRIVDKLDYVDLYSAKMQAMKFMDYKQFVNSKGITDNKLILKRYVAGKKSNWRNPNSVDVKFLSDKGSVIYYMQKYVMKSVSKDKANSDDIERIKAFGRYWSRSESLSRLKYKNWFDLRDLKNFIAYLKKADKQYKEVVLDYCRVIYFDWKALKGSYLNWFNDYINNNALMYNYLASV